MRVHIMPGYLILGQVWPGYIMLDKVRSV